MITEPEWESIRTLIESKVGARGEYFVTGKVVKADPDNMLVWLHEFGDQPIPIFTFDYEVKYIDTQPSGRPLRRISTGQGHHKKVLPLCPLVGQTVIVARELGTRRLPRCLGVLHSHNFVPPVDDV